MSIKISAASINAGLTLVATIEPQAIAIYEVARAIWVAANPGKTDADFINALASASSQTTTDSDAILTAKGFVRDPSTGVWSLGPTTVVPPMAVSTLPPVTSGTSAQSFSIAQPPKTA